VSRLAHSIRDLRANQGSPLMNASTNEPETMKRVVVDHHGGPEVL